MWLSHRSGIPVNHLLLVVLVWGSGVKGQPCPPGQITHIDRRQVLCCLPAECGPDHFLKYCKVNGTEDTCDKCPQKYGLYKRTSSFAYEPCHVLLLDAFEECTPIDENNEGALEDSKNCHCKLEAGYYFYMPEIKIGRTSTCQPVKELCEPGFQPTHSGNCEACPPNTVQDKTGFKLCRPQKNCTALRLETRVPGNTSTEAVCIPPPLVLPVVTAAPVLPHTSSTPSVLQTSSSTPSVVTVVGGENDAPMIVVVAVVCSVLLVCVVLILFLGHRKGWLSCVWKGLCHRNDVERYAGHGSPEQLSGQDNDNTSDNSCYTCADSCLTSSSKNNANAAPDKARAGASEPSKAPRPLPMLEAYMNMNGKCPQSLSSNGTLSEPLYDSISHNDKFGMSADSMPSYKNTNGCAPSPVKREVQGYPNRVHLSSGSEDDSLKKGPMYAQVQQRSRRNGKACAPAPAWATPWSSPRLWSCPRRRKGGQGRCTGAATARPRAA